MIRVSDNKADFQKLDDEEIIVCTDTGWSNELFYKVWQVIRDVTVLVAVQGCVSDEDGFRPFTSLQFLKIGDEYVQEFDYS